ncbi:MAG TPA: phage tail sheath subtilisin-like domain-containing protein [Thermoanaerobaculia bacterium]|nr:phage tail sheath subtilisin-like domain-containing protein [Thermoanaerobaculia bacterium]
MPEYLAPGVYVEEVSFRSKSIEGVSTTTTAFVGPTRYGPIDITPDVITSLVEYERTYGDRQQMQFTGGNTRHNYMWHAVRAFFENGGQRLYVVRAYRAVDAGPTSPPGLPGYAAALNTGGMRVWARFPGEAGNMLVRITLKAGPNVLGGTNAAPTIRGVVDHELVILQTSAGSPPLSPLDASLGLAQSYFANGQRNWRFTRGGGNAAVELTDLRPESGAFVQIVTATVTVVPVDPNIATWVYSDLALDPQHRRSGVDDSLSGQFAEQQASLSRARTIPIIMDLTTVGDGIAIAEQIISNAAGIGRSIGQALLSNKATDTDRSYDFDLTGGNDGDVPGVGEYEGMGADDPTSKQKSGLKALEDIDDISIVAAPGSTFNFAGNSADVLSITGALISHCERMRYRIAVLDSGDGQSVADVRDMRGQIDSSWGALYYPWYTIVDPVTLSEINVPPSGAVTGIYARNDIERAVYKAPANEVVETAIGLETILNKSQQDVLNPLGVNCFRFFEGRGFRLWGARTVSSDPEWKYVNLRRYFAYLEHSIDKGTQWAVFEPNGELLWANMRRTISDFLLNEWQNGALLGDKPESAYFVKCDRSTMTQNDLDNGRLVCLVGVSALRPAEYVIIRIGQWTADRKV